MAEKTPGIRPSEFEGEWITVKLGSVTRRVGEFFKNLDLLIWRRTRKLEKLQALKASMLEKMFPKDGADVPEVRFREFTGPWKRGRLSSYLETSTEKNVQNAGAAVSNYGIVRLGDVVYTKSPLRDAPFGIIKTNMGNPGIVSALYAVYHPKAAVHPPFVQTYFESNSRLNNYLRPIISKGAKNTINIGDDDALSGEVIFPEYDEQAAICNYFQTLGQLIFLTTRELEKLQSIKKALLEKMFV